LSRVIDLGAGDVGIDLAEADLTASATVDILPRAQSLGVTAAGRPSLSRLLDLFGLSDFVEVREEARR
jgi:hypothetical protein